MHCRRSLLCLRILLCHCLLFQFSLPWLLLLVLFSLRVLSFRRGGGVSVVDDVFGVGSWRTEVLVGEDLTEDGFSLKRSSRSVCRHWTRLTWMDLARGRWSHQCRRPVLKPVTCLMAFSWLRAPSGPEHTWTLEGRLWPLGSSPEPSVMLK